MGYEILEPDKPNEDGKYRTPDEDNLAAGESRPKYADIPTQKDTDKDAEHYSPEEYEATYWPNEGL